MSKKIRIVFRDQVPDIASRTCFSNRPKWDPPDSLSLHISNIFSGLDGLLSDCLKSEKKYRRRECEPDSQVDQQIRDFGADEIATTSTTMRTSAQHLSAPVGFTL
jgi:hypothetical protein